MNKLEQLSQAIVNLPDDLGHLRGTLLRKIQEGELVEAANVLLGAWGVALALTSDEDLLDPLRKIWELLV